MNNIHIPRPVAQNCNPSGTIPVFKCSVSSDTSSETHNGEHLKHHSYCDTVVTTAVHILLLLLLLLLLTVYYLTQNKITTVKYQPFLKFENDAVLSKLIGVNHVISGSLPPRHGASSGCG